MTNTLADTEATVDYNKELWLKIVLPIRNDREKIYSFEKSHQEIHTLHVTDSVKKQKCDYNVVMSRWCGMASLLSCSSYLGRLPTHSIVALKLFFLTVLELRAPLSSSGLEEAL